MPNKKGITALMITRHKGNIDAINVLLNAGTDPNSVDANDDTSLHYAAANYCCTEVLQEIINHRVDVNVANKNNATTLILACGKENKDVVNVLLNAGVDPHIADVNDRVPTFMIPHEMIVAQEVLQAIISHSADVNAADMNNVTALMIAYEKGNKDAINVLLSVEADPQHVAIECSSNMTLWIKQWLNPAGHFISLPALPITKSMSFNLVSRIICHMMKHFIWNRRSR